MSAAAHGSNAPLGASFWRLFASGSASNLADGIAVAALPLIAASLTRDPVLVSLVGTLAFLPWLLFAIPAGALVDRMDRRRAMQLANLLRVVILAARAAAMLAGVASIGVLYAASFLLGCAEAIFDNAARAMLPRVVDRRSLERGNALLSTSESVANLFLGAPLGAWLFALAATAPLGVNVAAYALAAVLIVTVHGRFRPEPTGATLGADIRQGLTWLLGHRILRSLVWVTGLGAFANALGSGVLVLFVLETLGVDAALYGVLVAVAGIGAIVGALFAPALARSLGRTTAMGALATANGLLTIAMGAWPELPIVLVAAAVAGACISAFNVQVMSVRQVLIPDALFGRVQGAYRTVLWGGIPLGTLAGGMLGAWLGLPAVYVIGGALGVVSGVATWWVLHRHRATIAAAFAAEAVAEPGSAGDPG